MAIYFLAICVCGVRAATVQMRGVSGRFEYCPILTACIARMALYDSHVHMHDAKQPCMSACIWPSISAVHIAIQFWLAEDIGQALSYPKAQLLQCS